MNNIVIGCDLGNSDTKTTHTKTPSAFGTFSKLPGIANECLFFNGKYYVPSEDRISVTDPEKYNTDSEFGIVLTLFGIAKELRYLKRNNYLALEEDMVIPIELAIGLPPGHLGLLDTVKTYFSGYFNKEIYVEYRKGNQTTAFHLDVKDFSIFPQGYAACVEQTYTGKLSITKRVRDYYIIDIGGITVDVVPIRKGLPEANSTVSLEMGTLKMFDAISDKITGEDQIVLDETVIKNILVRDKTYVDEHIKEKVFDIAEEWTERIISKLRQRGIEFRAYPCIFMGGGSVLLKYFLERNNLLDFNKINFILDAHANAIGYEYLYRVQKNRK